MSKPDNSMLSHYRVPIYDEVLKNFPAQQELQKSISSIATMTDYIQLENFWLCEIRTPQG